MHTLFSIGTGNAIKTKNSDFLSMRLQLSGDVKCLVLAIRLGELSVMKGQAKLCGCAETFGFAPRL